MRMNKALGSITENVKQFVGDAMTVTPMYKDMYKYGFAHFKGNQGSLGETARSIAKGSYVIGATTGSFLSGADMAHKGMWHRAGVGAMRTGAAAGMVFGSIAGAKALVRKRNGGER